MASNVVFVCFFYSVLLFKEFISTETGVSSHCPDSVPLLQDGSYVLCGAMVKCPDNYYCNLNVKEFAGYCCLLHDETGRTTTTTHPETSIIGQTEKMGSIVSPAEGITTFLRTSETISSENIKTTEMPKGITELPVGNIQTSRNPESRLTVTTTEAIKIVQVPTVAIVTEGIKSTHLSVVASDTVTGPAFSRPTTVASQIETPTGAQTYVTVGSTVSSYKISSSGGKSEFTRVASTITPVHKTSVNSISNINFENVTIEHNLTKVTRSLSTKILHTVKPTTSVVTRGSTVKKGTTLSKVVCEFHIENLKFHLPKIQHLPPPPFGCSYKEREPDKNGCAVPPKLVCKRSECEPINLPFLKSGCWFEASKNNSENCPLPPEMVCQGEFPPGYSEEITTIEPTTRNKLSAKNKTMSYTSNSVKKITGTTKKFITPNNKTNKSELLTNHTTLIPSENKTGSHGFNESLTQEFYRFVQLHNKTINSTEFRRNRTLTFTASSGKFIPCRYHKDCLHYREPKEWCIPVLTFNWTDKSCYCAYDTMVSSCVIERIVYGKREWSFCSHHNSTCPW